MPRPHMLSSLWNRLHRAAAEALQPLRVLQSARVQWHGARRPHPSNGLHKGCETSRLGGAQEIGQQLEAAALATRMAMEADTNTGMEDSAAPGAAAQQAPGKSAEKESKQVLSCQRFVHPARACMLRCGILPYI